MKYSQDIVQGLASYIDLQDIKAFIERRTKTLPKDKIYNIGSFVTGVIIQKCNIEYVIFN